MIRGLGVFVIRGEGVIRTTTREYFAWASAIRCRAWPLFSDLSHRQNSFYGYIIPL